MSFHKMYDANIGLPNSIEVKYEPGYECEDEDTDDILENEFLLNTIRAVQAGSDKEDGIDDIDVDFEEDEDSNACIQDAKHKHGTPKSPIVQQSIESDKGSMKKFGIKLESNKDDNEIFGDSGSSDMANDDIDNTLFYPPVDSDGNSPLFVPCLNTPASSKHKDNYKTSTSLNNPFVKTSKDQQSVIKQYKEMYLQHKCSECGKCFPFKSCLRRHLSERHANTAFSDNTSDCPRKNCEDFYLDMDNNVPATDKDNYTSANGNSPVKTHKDQQGILKQYKEMYLQQLQHKCSECGKCFPFKSSLRRHLSEMHANTAFSDDSSQARERKNRSRRNSDRRRPFYRKFFRNLLKSMEKQKEEQQRKEAKEEKQKRRNDNITGSSNMAYGYPPMIYPMYYVAAPLPAQFPVIMNPAVVSLPPEVEKASVQSPSPFVCGNCQLTFTCKKHLACHMQHHATECGDRYSSKFPDSVESTSHSNSKESYKCASCGDVFDNDHQWGLHMMNSHKVDLPSRELCSYCN